MQEKVKGDPGLRCWVSTLPARHPKPAHQYAATGGTDTAAGAIREQKGEKKLSQRYRTRFKIHLLPLVSTHFEWDLNAQKGREDLEKLKELTSRWEISVQSLLIELRQATTPRTAASAFDHMDICTLFSTSLHFLIFLSLASISPKALAFFSLSRHAVKKVVHTHSMYSCGISHTTTYLQLQKSKRLGWGNRNTGLRKNWNIGTIFHVCSYVLVQCTLVNLSTAST